MTYNQTRGLIVFVKNPVPGKVKTRLAATIGDKRALNIYLQLLSHTIQVASHADSDLILCYSDFIPENDTWTSLKAHRSIQRGDDLGARMHNALSDALIKYERVVLIGSDCGELTTEFLDIAFDSLLKVDSVIGPAHDGGYYIIGSNQSVPGIFDNIDWSTEHVFHQTLSRLIESGLNFEIGKTLHDVDDEGDWKALRLSDPGFWIDKPETFQSI